MTSPRGTYLLIADALRAKLRKGSITDKLPSEAQIMKDHGVSRTTARRALDVLKTEGLIESAPGVGWRVKQERGRRSLLEEMTDLLRATPIGERFPSEAKLCETFGVSRSAVRDALKQMEGNGLLATVHGKGRTVQAMPNTPTTS